MARYNEELTKAGVLLALDGLHPPSEGARVSVPGGKATVTDGPFTEAKEVIGGYWMIQAESKRGGDRVGVALPDRRRDVHRGAPIFEMSDFPPELQEAAGRSQTPPEQTTAV